MPRIATEIPQTYESVVRPVALEVARKVCSLLNQSEGISILYPGAAEEAPMTGSTLSNRGGDLSTFKTTTRLRIEVREETVEDRVLSTAVHQNENIPIFNDPLLKTVIRPVYSAHRLVLVCELRTENRTMARKIRDDLKMRTAMNRAEHLHEISYHYTLPETHLYLLKKIHGMREAQAGYNQDFDTWVRAHITPRATNLTTLIGTQPTLAVAETQLCTWGHFSDFLVTPEPEEKERENGAWNIKFEYTFQYDQIIACVAEWPLVIHNQLIDEPWREKPNASGSLVDPDRRLRSASRSRKAMDHFTNIYSTCQQRLVDGIAIPEFDDWSPAIVHPDTSTVAAIMLQVDPQDPCAVLNLQEIPNYEIDEDIIAFMKAEAPYLNHFGQSPVHISMYLDDVPMDEGTLTIDANLNVRSTDPQNLRRTYHLRIALLNDLFMLSSAAMERFRQAGPACMKILSTLQWKLMGNAFVPQLLGGTMVSLKDLRFVAQRLNDLKTPHKFGIEYRMLTVGNFIVVTHRSSDYADHDTQAIGARPTGTSAGSSGGTPIPGCDG